MNHSTRDADFGTMTDEEQMQVMGGDGAFAHALGYGIGFAAHWVEAALVIGGAMGTTCPVPPYQYIATLL
jgi:hypothetical protein